MAVLRRFSFDDVDSAARLGLFWGNTGNIAFNNSTPRTGANCIACNTSPLSLTVSYVDFLAGQAASEYGVIGFGLRMSGSGSGGICGVSEGGSVFHLSFMRNASNQLEVRRGDSSGTVLATSTQTFTNSVWVWVEIKFRIHDTLGLVQIKVEGIDWINISGQDTRNGGTNGTWSRFHLGTLGSGGASLLDDLYFASDSSDTFLGPATKVINKTPNGDGAHAAWTRSSGAGTHASHVDEMPANDDTDYVATGAAGAGDLNKKDTFTKAAFGITGTVHGCSQRLWLKKSATGDTRGVKPIMRSGGSDFQGTEVFPGTGSYIGVEENWAQNPNGPAAWTVTTADASEGGVEITTIS